MAGSALSGTEGLTDDNRESRRLHDRGRHSDRRHGRHDDRGHGGQHHDRHRSRHHDPRMISSSTTGHLCLWELQLVVGWPAS